ncbi:MAG TPA: hypothetical protein VF641_06405 [Methylobacterium sp.]|jgi:hypothetical protein
MFRYSLIIGTVALASLAMTSGFGYADGLSRAFDHSVERGRVDIRHNHSPRQNFRRGSLSTRDRATFMAIHRPIIHFVRLRHPSLPLYNDPPQRFPEP